MLTVERQVEEIRKAMSKHLKEKLEFEPLKWKRLKRTRNCFTYAFNIKSGIIEKDLISTIGALIGSPWKSGNMSLKKAYEILCNTMKVCGISFKESNFEEKPSHDYYKVAVCISAKDIHWIRQDDDGFWSHKQGWFAEPTNVDKDGSLITNPEQANIETDGEILDTKYFLISRNY